MSKKYSEEELKLIEEKAIRLIPLAPLVGLVKEGFDAVDKRIARIAIEELTRRANVINDPAEKCAKSGCDTVGVSRVPGQYVLSVGVAGEEEPRIAVQGQFLFQCLETALEKLP